MNLFRAIETMSKATFVASFILLAGCSIVLPTATAVKPTAVQPIGKPIPTNTAAGNSAPLIVTALPSLTGTTSISATKTITALKATNWKQLLTTDPQISYDKKATDDALKINKVDNGPFIRAKTTFGATDVGGHASILKDSITYGDISGDGQAEAIIMLSSGGSAGNIGALIYSPNSGGKLVLVGVLDGYKMSVRLENDELVVTRPIIVGFEPNCCPSGFSTKRYKVATAQFDVALNETASTNVGAPEAKPLVIEQFYKLINTKKFKEAYDMLSPTMREQQPFEAWQAGFVDTKDIRINTKLLPSGVVLVDINNKNGSGAQKFSGIWGLTWDDKTTRWQLSESNLKLIDGSSKDITAPKIISQKVSQSLVYYGSTCGNKPTKLTFTFRFSDSSGVKDARLEYTFIKDKASGGVAAAKGMEPFGADGYTYTIDMETEGTNALKSGPGTLKAVVVAIDIAGNQGVTELPVVQVQPCK